MQVLRIGFLLAWRQIQRSSLWTTSLIVLVMALTFLNLVAVSGILVGLIAGSEQAFQNSITGDISITALDTEDHILETPAINATLAEHPAVTAYSTRFDSSGVVEANFQDRHRLSDDRDTVTARITGINPAAEARTTNLKTLVVEGSYFTPGASNEVLVGSLLLKRYTEDFPDVVDSLENVQIGDDLRITIQGSTRTFTVAGIVDAKVGELTSTIFMPTQELRRLANRVEPDADRIAVTIPDTVLPTTVTTQLKNTGMNNYAKIQTFAEALPKFLLDIKGTFNLLGIFIGAVGIVVASITIFIIIFINALSRRRQIGILKGIGIDRRAIETAYVIQAGFYVVCGSTIAVVITYAGLIPYFANNPIDFPFSDGILVATPLDTAARFGIVFVVTLIAGFIPAWLIARQNTLNAILGRK